MLSRMFRPFFKRFLGLFISMAFVSMLSVGLLITFATSITNLRATYTEYLESYGFVDAQIKTNFVKRDKLAGVKAVEGVEKADVRLTLDCYLKKKDGRTITSRVFSFNEEENELFKRYVLSSGEKSQGVINASVIRKFAANNDIKIGDTLKIGYFNLYIDIYINEIIETPEAMYVRANDYILSDNQDFGFIYIEESELNAAINKLAEKIRNEIATNETYRQYYEQARSALILANIDLPDLETLELTGDYASMFGNQLIIKAAEGQSEALVAKNVEDHLAANGINVKSTTLGNNLPYRVYMKNAMRQLNVAAIFLPVFFYSVTMIVIGLFINQIIKTMTKDIGIMTSIGVGKWDILSIFFVFTALMAITAGVLGVGVGYLLNGLMTSIMIKTYSLPLLANDLNVAVIIIAIGMLLVFSEVATLLSGIKVFGITPKDAVISNESKRRKLPKWLSDFIDKAPMNTKLGVNSIAQNPRRFLVSTFSIFAAFVLILLSSFFYVAKEELMAQTVDRRMTYDCQVYFTQKVDEEFIKDFKSQSFVSGSEDCYYTYVKVSDVEEDIYLECLAVNAGKSRLVNIPDKNGFGNLTVPREGLILPKTDAERLGVKAGDKIKIGNKEVLVSDISFQYFHPITYMSKAQMDELEQEYVSSVLVNVTDENAFLDYLANGDQQGLTVFTHSIKTDLQSIFDTVNVFIAIMIAFSLGMGFIILAIMSQNALMEQKRQLSVLRAVGFTVKNISDIWTLQSIGQFIISALFAIPVGVLVSMILFSLCSSPTQIYPFIFDLKVVLFAIVFILLIIVGCHLFSMASIKRWNLADETRSRE
ncbi:MAG: ABC transporter permease [Clostridia bacterium]|nr:ABC transporter permease [Clostridia bacterium]